MTKTIIAYGSTTGSTQTLAEEIESTFNKNGFDARLVNITDIEPPEITGYDLIVLGCSTWGEGELQDDFIPFEREMDGLKLEGKKAACFGPGDSDYVFFCEAVNILEARLESCGAELVAEGLKIDGDVDDQLDLASEWAEKLLANIS
ncbi:flavodoxin [Methanolobus sp. WCC1]|uniref:flavodoxin n=1 Tax=unclassified Methanolobus TaxID=2629569 RepID=UPI0032495F7B